MLADRGNSNAAIGPWSGAGWLLPLAWTLVAVGLFVAGFWFISRSHASDAVIGAMSGGRGAQLAFAMAAAAFFGAEFVFMFFVADDLCPNTPILFWGWVRLTGLLEFAAATVALVFLARAFWLTWA